MLRACHIRSHVNAVRRVYLRRYDKCLLALLPLVFGVSTLGAMSIPRTYHIVMRTLSASSCNVARSLRSIGHVSICEHVVARYFEHRNTQTPCRGWCETHQHAHFMFTTLHSDSEKLFPIRNEQGFAKHNRIRLECLKTHCLVT